MCCSCSWRSPTEIIYNHPTHPCASVKPEVMTERKRTPFPGCTSDCAHPPSISGFCISSPADKNDTLTLQVDKCVLTILGEISSGSAGSLPGTHFYLHLLCLAEETLNLLCDLWLPFQNPPPCSLLFGCRPDFSPFCFAFSAFLLADPSH